ncbi:inositol monophosphatase family protein [Alkalihalobacillus sp. AL-G]|uniref:inositol monophosphatase family protein n=1 Tax=Alkalihalobacillus sp. AL-G TaxID=2926399 RepID=UPI00272C332B|nr:inositol monophosphatase family protein [Alkalihalobacillus sp. AL-G]WLD95012.1 inositol monophosphatase family protein [Alkalihalobacillus sp. AL-G]
MSLNWQKICEQAITWATEAGEVIRESFEDQLTIETKSNADDLVTNMDREIEGFLINKINENYPDHKILGEEGIGEKIDSLKGTVWLIDPIDGTMNFVHQQTNFAISIGVYNEGIGMVGIIYNVVYDEMFYAIKGEGAYLNGRELPKLSDVMIEESIVAVNATWITENRRIDPSVLAPIVKKCRGTRSYGSAAIELAFVAAGRLDAYITMRLSPWDFAAGKILIEEVGGMVTTLNGEPLRLLEQNSVFAAKTGLHERIISDYIKG